MFRQPRPAALAAFAQSRHVGVVAGLDRQTGEAAQGLRQGEYAPAQIAAAVDHAVLVHRAGDTDAQPVQRLAAQLMPGAALFNGPGNVRQNVLPVFPGICGNLPFLQ